MSYLNCVSKVKPGNRPILIIRQIINFEPKVLQETLKSMEQHKENKVTSPTIIETSDFLWFKAPGVRKSRSSYMPYVIQEMSFEEGKHELVTRLKIITLEDYTKIYDVIGSYVGSFAKLRKLLKCKNMNINKALNILRKLHIFTFYQA